ncbi:MAG: hypothetical protein V3S62_04885 [Acidimicrobiia bacterium]
MTALEISRPDARRAALGGLIDYAGLFPPASLDMEAAVDGYRAARESSESWMVNRFICPASRLEELVAVLAPTMTGGEDPWRLAVTAGPGWTESLAPDAGAVRTFTATVAAAAKVDLVEIRVPTEVASDAIRLAEDSTDVLRAFDSFVFFEIPWQLDPGEAFDALAVLRKDSSRALGVKIRCGGLEAALFPDAGEVARFIAAAVEKNLPMKATAGLHHPFHHTDEETGFVHHGFVNMLTAAALASQGSDVATLAAVLADEDSAAFSIDRGGVAWRDQSVGSAALAEMRSSVLIGYGSCSFAEPVEDLTALGVLPL